jgi:hypothetical protein
MLLYEKNKFDADNLELQSVDKNNSNKYFANRE